MSIQQVPTAQAEKLARDGFISWRLRDVPAIYYALIPETTCCKSLWQAEQRVRAQLARDLELLARPFRQIGPSNFTMLDDSRMSSVELIAFGLEVGIPQGMEDQPRRPIVLPIAPDPSAAERAHPENATEAAGDD